jgi:hypothetical protein
MDFTSRIRIPTRAWVLLLTLLVALCAADLARPAIVMAGGESCAGPACETQITCGQPTQPHISSGSSIYVVAVLVPAEHSLGLEKTEARASDPPSARVTWESLGSLPSRSPPAV